MAPEPRPPVPSPAVAGSALHPEATAPSGETRDRAWWRRAIACAAIVFGVATIAAGGRVLFGDASARASAGAYVPFVVAFNLAAGFAYVAAGFGLALRARWATWLATAIAGATVLVFLAFGLHVATGGPYERRTVVAMTIRSTFWIAFATVVPRYILRSPRARGAGRLPTERPAP